MSWTKSLFSEAAQLDQLPRPLHGPLDQTHTGEQGQSAYAKHRSQVEARNLALVSSDYGKSHQLGRRVGVRRTNAV